MSDGKKALGRALGAIWDLNRRKKSIFQEDGGAWAKAQRLEDARSCWQHLQNWAYCFPRGQLREQRLAELETI